MELTTKMHEIAVAVDAAAAAAAAAVDVAAAADLLVSGYGGFSGPVGHTTARH